MMGGTFIDFLRRVQETSRHGENHWRKIITMLMGAANGLGYLHSVGVLHCDLKGDNLLLDEREGECLKLADFGLATARDHIMKKSEAVGTYTHMAPEILEHRYDQWDTCSDIFSFGIVITEAISGDKAEEIIDETRDKDFGLIVEGLKGLLDPNLHPLVAHHLCDLAVQCCDQDPAVRPSAFGLIAKLETLEVDDIILGGSPVQDFRIISIKAKRDKLMSALQVLERHEQQAMSQVRSSQSLCDQPEDGDQVYNRSLARSKHILKQVEEENVRLKLAEKIRAHVEKLAAAGQCDSRDCQHCPEAERHPL